MFGRCLERFWGHVWEALGDFESFQVVVGKVFKQTCKKPITNVEIYQNLLEKTTTFDLGELVVIC